MSNVQRTSTGVYRFRRVVPDDLRSIIGRREITRTLGTSDPAQAKKLARVVADEIDELFEAARRKLTQAEPTQAQPAGPLVPAQIEIKYDPEFSYEEATRLAGVWLHERRAFDDSDLVMSREADSPVRRLLIERGLIPTPPDRNQLIPNYLDHDDYHSARNFAQNDPDLSQAILEASRIPIDLTGCTEEERLELILSKMVANPGLSHTLVRIEVDFFIMTQGLNLSPTGNSYKYLRSTIARAWLVAVRERKRKRDGDWEFVEPPPQPVATPVAVVPTQVEPQPKEIPVAEPVQRGPTISELYDMYSAEAGTNPKMALEHSTIFNRLRNVLGGDVTVGSITKAQIVEFKTILFRLPTYMTALQKKMPLREVATETPETADRLSNTSVRKSISILQTIFEWGVRNGVMDINPAKGTVPAKAGKTAGPARLPYSDEDINLIFTSPIWAGCQSDAKYWEPGTHRVRDERWWLPILALFTGCRLEEMGQLLTRDVKREGNIWFLDITTVSEDENGPVKRLKTASSHRRVPIHPTLVKLGFLNYVNNQKADRLFSGLKPDRVGTLTSHFSKAWGRYCDRIGLTDTRKTFHSFRHTFKRACRGLMGKDVHDAITGHASGDVGGSYGRDESGAGMSLTILAEAIARVEFPGFPDLK